MALSNAERQARWRAKRDTEIERLRKAGRAERDAEIERLRKAATEHGGIGLRFLRRRAAKPKAPPLPPDEAREKIIKGLRTENRNLKAKVRAMLAPPKRGPHKH
jgi:hypothetical protein